MSILQKKPICFLKDLGPHCITGKMYSRHLLHNRGLDFTSERTDQSETNNKEVEQF